MIKTYHIFKRLFSIILIGIILTTVMSIVAFLAAYDGEAKTLNMDSPLSIILMIMMALVLLTIVFLSFKTRGLSFEKIKKDRKLTSFCGLFAAIMAFGSLINDIVIIIVNKGDYSTVACMKTALTILTCAYFVIEALPHFIKGKNVVIPLLVRRILSVATIMWAILGIFSIYFDTSGSILSSSIIYNGKIISYVTAAMFFVFDTEREFTKVKYSMLIFSALAVELISSVISVGLIFGLVFGRVELSYLGYDMLCYFLFLGIGLFAISRVYSVLETLKLTTINTEN